MSKTSRKSLPAVVVTLCLLIAQAALFGQMPNSGVAHADGITTGAAIYLNPTTSSFGSPQIVSVRGTGFTPNDQVLVAFNSPWSKDGSPLGQRAVPPTVNRPGDNRPLPPRAESNGTLGSGGGSAYPNVIEVLANTDAFGNLVTSNGLNGTVQFGIPSTAVDGTYEVTAVDLGTVTVSGNTATGITASVATAGTTYTITRAPNQQLKVTPLSDPMSAQIGGELTVTALPNTFNNGDEIQFYLEDFAASASFGSPSVPSFGSFDPLIPPAQQQLQLNIATCGTIPVTGQVAAQISNCSASINGDVSAQVQLYPSPVFANLSGNGNGASLSQPCILSTYYYDQVYAIVAKAVGNVYGLPYSANQVRAGFHLDHGMTQISLSTNQATLSGPVTVSGTGFGAFATVSLFFATLLGTSSPAVNSCQIQNAPGTPGSGVFFITNCSLGSTTTDANGSFRITVNIQNFTNTSGGTGTGLAGYILAEDFGCSTGNNSIAGGLRLNEAATAAFTISQTNSGTLTIVTAAGGTSTTAAISSTVTVTGTGYLPNEAVDVTLAGPVSDRRNTALPPGTPLQPPLLAGQRQPCTAETILTIRSNAAGVATGSFLVPETCNTTVYTSSQSTSGAFSLGARINAGANVSVDATGEQSGLDNNATMKIPATSATISPTFGFSQTGASIAVTLSGQGFAANEPVTFQFGTIDPFTGLLQSTLISVSSTSDALGNVVLTNQTLPCSAATSCGSLGTLFNLFARGLNSSFSSGNIAVALPFFALPNQGNLNCPVNNVLPGQPIQIFGFNFSGLQFITVNFSGGLLTFNGVSLSATTPFTINVPLGTAPGSYSLVVSGLVSNGGTIQEELRTCTINVGTTSPAVQANPNIGPIGITTTVTGQGFGANEPITVSLQFVDTGALTGTSVPGTAQTIATADANGNFTGIFSVKSSVNSLLPNVYNLAAVGGQTGLVARTPFTVVTGTGINSVTSLYFAEGYTGTVAGGAAADFSETLSILNANNFTTTYTVTYFLETTGGASTQKTFSATIGASSVAQRSVNTDVGSDQRVAALVTSQAPLAAERVINRSQGGKSLDGSSSLGQLINTAAAVPDAGVNYYFASGEVQLTNEEYLTLLNPTAKAGTVTINILPQGLANNTTAPTIAPITASVPANSRVTVPIRKQLTSFGGLHFGMSVNSNVPLAAERVEYYGDGIGSGKYGASTKPAGTSAFRQYIFANDVATFPSDGGNATISTGNDLSEVDIINPGASAAGSATVTVSFFTKAGLAINSQQVQVDGGTRETIEVNDVVGTQADVFSVVVTSDKNVFVEKPIFYGGDPSKGGTHAVAVPSGAPAGLTSVALPYLDLTSTAGSAISQTVFLYNPGVTTITVRATYVSGNQTAVKTYTVAKNAITTVVVNADAASLPKGALGAIFEVISSGNGTSDSFVASVQTNTADFSYVLGNQGTYPVGAVGI